MHRPTRLQNGVKKGRKSKKESKMVTQKKN